LAVYFHTLFLILFGAVLVESSIHILSINFWLLVSILFGVILTFDIITHENENEEDKDEKIKK